MRFGPVPLDQAQGAILAHAVPLPDGRVLRKGRVLDGADLAALGAAGAAMVTVARLDPDDLDENAAAARLARAFAGRGITCSAAATGRVNLFADAAGIVALDVAAIGRINAVNPMITLASLPQYQRVAAGNMVATIKIISYAVPTGDVARAIDCAVGDAEAGVAVVSLLTPLYRSASLIETTLGQPVSDKGARALGKRLQRLGISLQQKHLVPHDRAALSEAYRHATGDLICVLTASATSDIADVGPAALQDAGGQVSQFGMPVDPGNLLFLGDLAGKPVIGLPGCARSPALNGADWVLERVICGRRPDRDDFAAMGVGGLLKEIPARPQPRNPAADKNV